MVILSAMLGLASAAQIQEPYKRGYWAGAENHGMQDNASQLGELGSQEGGGADSL